MRRCAAVGESAARSAPLSETLLYSNSTKKTPLAYPSTPPQGPPGPGQRLARGRDQRHVAFGFEAMRYLIALDDMAVCNLEQQRRFFRVHVQPRWRMR